jgi:hypothetical protein
MKKLIAISILLTILSVAAFAQFKASLNADFYPELLKASAPLDDLADREKAYSGTGRFDFFSSWGTWYSNELRLSLNYDDPDGNYSGYLRFRGDGLIRPGDGFYTSGGVNNGGDVDANKLFDYAIDEYAVKGKVGIITGYFGNQANRGKVNRFQNFSNFQDGVKVDNYGILMPRQGTIGGSTNTNSYLTRFPQIYGTVADLDVNNIRRVASDGATATKYNATYVAATVDLSSLAPISVELASSVFGGYDGYTAASPSWSKGNAAIRVSGSKIADIVTFDLIYKIIGGDQDTDKNEEDLPKQGSGPEPDGEGTWHNSFGVYANIAILDGLGIGIGYSGYVKVDEDEEVGDDTNKYTNPFYSGIDLRFAFTGIDKLTATLNNNISFTGNTGKDPADNQIVNGVFGALGEDQKDSYFGMYNALGLNYKLSDALTARAEFANRFGSYTFDNDGDKDEYLYDKLRIVLSAAYSANAHVGLEAGLAFQIEHATLKVPDDSATLYNEKEFKGGDFTFGIPLRLHVVF